MRKKIVAISLLIFLCSGTISDAKEIEIPAPSAILIERDTGVVLTEKNSHERLPPASMTKIMTMILIMEALEEKKITLKEEVVASERAASMGGSQIFLEAGEVMTVNDLLKGVAIASGNDASVALAEHLYGSEEVFVKQMNKKAKQLGLKNTHFENATGLPAKNHYSSAYDMAKMAKELLNHEKIIDYTKQYEDYLRKGTDREFWLVNTNRLVRFFDEVDGLKTGYTSEAKYCLTATAKKGDMRVISVVMGAESPKERNKMTMDLFAYAFSSFETKKQYTKGSVVRNVPIEKAKQQTIPIVANEDVSILTKKGQTEKWEESIHIDELTLPIKKGQKVGKLTLKQEGKVMVETDLIAKETIEEASVFTFFTRSLRSLTHR